MANTKKIPVIYKGEIIDFHGVNTTTGSEMCGFCGQLFSTDKRGNKLVHIATPIGICTVKKAVYNGMNAVEVIKIVVPIEQERQQCKEKFDGKYLCRVYDLPESEEIHVEYYNKTAFIEEILPECRLNTVQNSHIGRTLKNITHNIYDSATHTEILTYQEFLEVAKSTVPEDKQNTYNLGIIAERVILKSKKAFTDKGRKNDGYYKGKPVELKTNFSAKLRQFLAMNDVGISTKLDTSGTSQSNVIVKYAPKKAYAWK